MRILIAEDDEALARFVRQGLEAEHHAVDVFADGESARAAALDFDYDVVILDLNLPKLDGVSVLRHLRSKKPSMPVLVLTQRTRVEDRVQCLDTGADDYVPKQISASSLDILHIRPDLVAKIRAAAHSRQPQTSEVPVRKPPQSHSATGDSAPGIAPAIVAIGASTGGPTALEQILPLFPKDFPLPILLVQHMPAGFTAAFAKRLNTLCFLSVREATHRETIEPGVVYLAPAGKHMRVEPMSASRAIIALDSHPQDCLHIPSVNVLMNSVAAVFKKRALSVILTGMGSDGAEGMKAIYRQGGFTIGQNQATCTVYGMPRACAELGVLTRVLPLLKIPEEILQATRSRKRA